MYGRWFQFPIQTEHKESHWQQDRSMGRVDVNHVRLLLLQCSSQSTKETQQSVITIKQGNTRWRRNPPGRFKISTDRNIALVHHWQTMLVILAIGWFYGQYDMKNAQTAI